MLKIEKPIDYISIIIFCILIIFWCDLDLHGLLVRAGLNTNIGIGLILTVLVLLGILSFIYISKIVGVLLFVIIMLTTKAMIGYTELFTTTSPSTTSPSTTTTTTNPNLVPASEFSATASDVEKFLLRQIADDPNTTVVDKRIMSDITQKYFANSSKLAELRSFDIASETANMLPGQQVIVGLGTVANQH